MLLNDRDQIIAMTAEWTGERYPNGRPRVSDEKIEILKNLTQEEIWQPLYSCGYRFQFQGDLKPLHPDKKLYGRAVTCCFMPQRPDLRQHVFNVARSRGWKGDCNQWVIDSLEENDVVVCDLYDKILRGTFVGGNLTTAVKARTKNGGVVVWGGVRDLEQMQNIDVQVFYRGVDPTPIRDCQITAFNGPCRIGAAICLPGDIVIGTKNGILFVPSHMVDYVIEHAYKSQVRDLYAFPKLEAGIYTTADVDAVVWNDQMMQALLNFIDTNPAAAKYRGLDWSVELRAAAGDEAAIDELYQQFDIERYLLDQGHKEIVYLNRDLDSDVEKDRLHGFLRAMQAAPDVKYWVNNGKTSSPRTAFTALEQLKQAHPGITAVLTWGDIYAAGALQYLYQQNLRVPQDVEVVTCGDTLMPYLAPAISSVEVPLREMARTAVAIINDQLADGQKDFVKTVTLEPLFTRRGV